MQKKQIKNILYASFFIFSFSSAAMANYDLEKYKPTLDDLSPSGTVGIKSAYTISFTPQTSSIGADFMSYKVINGIQTPIYYTYLPKIKDGLVSKPRTAGTGNMEGHYFNLSISGGGQVLGAAISGGTISEIKGDFINNTATATGSGSVYGGAVTHYQSGTPHFIGDFIGNKGQATGTGDAYGAAIYGDYPISATGNFIANSVLTTTGTASAGAIYAVGGAKEIKGSFIGNHADGATVWGGTIVNGTDETVESITGRFIGNYALASGYAIGGVYYNYGDTYEFSGEFIANHSESKNSNGYAGVLYIGTGKLIRNMSGTFIGNYAIGSTGGVGGVIASWGNIWNLHGTFIKNYAEGPYAEGGVISNNTHPIRNITGSFSENYVLSTTEGAGGAIAAWAPITNITADFTENYVQASNIDNAKGGAVYIEDTTVSFNAKGKERILFEGNYVTNGTDKVLNSIYLGGTTAVANFNIAGGTYAEIKDPIKGDGTLNKDKVWYFDADGNPTTQGNGGGDLRLWGDNSEFTGTVNINTGHFYMLFDENSPYTERQTSTLAANINFGTNTVFRPQITATKLAALTGTVNGSSAVYLPYGVSKLNIGTYDYTGNNTTSFTGWNNVLSRLTTGSDTQLEIKRDLDGYNGLNVVADQYRKLDSLGYEDRYLFDELYATASVSDQLRDVLTAVEGEDLTSFEQMHKGTIRQFNRQISSRIHNRNCDGDDCNTGNSVSDDHFWMNVGHNWMDKDNNRNHVGYKYNPTSVAFGYDYDITPEKFNVGVAFGHSFGKAKSDNGFITSENDVKEYLLSFYGKYKLNRLYFAGTVGYGLIRNKTTFITDSINAKGKYNSDAYFAYLETGYNVGVGTFVIEPYIAADYTFLQSNKHDEQGVGARHFDSMDSEIFDVPFGVRISNDFDLKEYLITPMMDVSYSYNFGEKNVKTAAHFVNSPSNIWRVSSSSEERDTIRVGFNVKINNKEHGFALNIGYAADYRTDYTDNQIYGTIRWDF